VLSVTLLSVVACVAASSSSSSSSSEERATFTIYKTSNTESTSAADLQFASTLASTLSFGSTQYFFDNLFNTDGNAPVGTGAGSCFVSAPTAMSVPGTVQCTFSYSLPGGQIAVQGPFTPGATLQTASVQAILGGTGRYRGVQGEVVASTQAGGAQVLLQFYLRDDGHELRRRDRDRDHDHDHDHDHHDHSD